MLTPHPSRISYDRFSYSSLTGLVVRIGQKEKMNMNARHLPIIENLISDPYLFCQVLSVYKSLLTEQKQLHEINCPECTRKDKPCKKYYWLVVDLQEVTYAIEQLAKEARYR
jgi:hypothetical protein